jgi:hypothetical protein
MWILAQVDPVTQGAIQAAVQGADLLATKDMKWWFAAVLIIGAFAGLVVLKWLLASHQKYITSMETQLTEQRTTNSALNRELLTYITTDHLKGIEALNKMSDSMEKLATAIHELDKKRD